MSKNRDRRIKSTEAWNIVKNLKTNNTRRKSLLNMKTLEKRYRTVLTEGTFKYHVSCTDGKITVRIILPIFPPSSHSQVVFSFL